MEIGMALPTMAAGTTRSTFETWCRGIDDGPFSSISAGERITFHNPELLVTLSAAAALTRRVRILANLVVVPLHAPALLAKQLATLDVVADGRLEVGVGVGGRQQDFLAVDADFTGRHQRMEAAVAELRRLWAGEPAYEGGDPVGPSPLRPGGPPVLVGALGPRSMARAARWADGVTGFTIGADAAEVAGTNRLAVDAWTRAGRTERPRLVNGTFFLLGGDDAQEELRRFARAYLAVFGDRAAEGLSRLVNLSTPDRLRQTLDEAEAAGCDEFVLVPGSVDPTCLELAAEVVAGR
jgi:alkanesulfonate monooxygenase SsuD/methylene tetrahydromethanopterin reductase-like flavin-dependent oxidoreductase (luciferase family)